MISIDNCSHRVRNLVVWGVGKEYNEAVWLSCFAFVVVVAVVFSCTRKLL